MDAFIIKGGRRLRGAVRVHGSKNATLPLMAAALLTDGPITLHDVPDLSDLRNMQKLLDTLGCKTERDEATRTTRIQVTDPSKSLAHYDIVRTMRAGICALGPLLARRGEAKVSMPGGCAIGDRPVDLHIRGLKALGAQIHLDEGYIVAKAPHSGGRRRLIGTHVFLGGPNGSTVLGTANVMSAATLAEGVTVIECAACEPEIEDLANMLNAMGAKITGAGGPRVIIEGVDELKGAEHTVMPDRIEAGTYVMAAAITNGEITLENFPTSALMAALDRLEEIGVSVRAVDEPLPAGLSNGSNGNGNGHTKQGGATDVLTAARPAAIRAANPALATVRWHDTVRIEVARRLSPVHVVTQPHPGFPTDLQAQIMALLCLADGNSIITEKIYPDRFLHVAEYLRMGANCLRNGPSVMITGVKELVGAPVMASDLRASAGLVLAGLAARGTTTINRVYHLDRGYERMEQTLQQLGADIERIDAPSV